MDNDSNIVYDSSINGFPYPLAGTADTFDLVVYDINGFYVTDNTQAHLGLASDEDYHFFNEGCSYSLDVFIPEPNDMEISIEYVDHPCYTYYNNDEFIDPANGAMSIELIGGVDSLTITLVNQTTNSEISVVSYAESNDIHSVNFNNLSAGIL